MHRNRLLSLVSLAALAPVAALAQRAHEQPQTIGGAPATPPRQLVLTDLLRVPRFLIQPEGEFPAFIRPL